MASRDKRQHELVGLGHPLLDLMVHCDMDMLEKYKLKRGEMSLAQPHHSPLYEEIFTSPAFAKQLQLVAGGATQNTIRVAQWICGAPGFTAYIGCIGDDAYGARLRDAAAADGVATYYDIAPAGTPTGTCAVLVQDGERTLVTRLSAAAVYARSHFDSAPVRAAVDAARIVYSAGFFLTNAADVMLDCCKAASASGGKSIYAFNLSAPFLCQYFKEQMHAVLPYADVVFGNEAEAAAFAEANGFAVVAVPVDPIAPSAIVDTNGAGDAFVGGFLALLAQGASLVQAARAGNWAAGHIIQRSGCTFDRGAKCPIAAVGVSADT